jgi:diguanylate cyclase (GGDEF)-like protein
MVMKSTLPNEALPRPKLLLVDDQPLNIRLLHELFRNEFDVFMATDGLQAIAKAQSSSPDLILLDVVMPGMDGYEVCQRLKADPITSEIPIIFVTAHFDEAEEVRGFELGAVDFIHKPINPIITKARINNQLVLRQQKELLRSIALIDGLTGIANRRKFDEELQADWMQCTRAQQFLSLLIIDVDLFKLYNDRYGHQLGDSCLQLIAQTLKHSLNRPYDLAARYGGEEFACILPHTEINGATHIAEKILSNIRNLKIEHLDSKIDQIVTASIGIATTTPQIEGQPALLLEAADQQLYLSKQKGRACVNAVIL